MATDPLNALKTEDFVVSLGMFGTAAGLRRHLLRSEYVADIRRGLRTGEINESAIRRFVDQLMRQWKRGVQFPFDLALAALAVALEQFYSEFTNELLLDLERLHSIAELDLAPRVAKLSRRALRAGRQRITERSRQYLKDSTELLRLTERWNGKQLQQIPRTRAQSEWLVFEATAGPTAKSKLTPFTLQS